MFDNVVPRPLAPQRQQPRPHAEPRRLSVLFVAEAEPFYLGETFRKLIETRPDWLDIAAVALLDFAPFGARGGVLARAVSLTRMFGVVTAVRTFFRLVQQWSAPARRLPTILGRGGVELRRIRDLGDADALIDRLDPDAVVAIGLNRIVPAELLNRGNAAWINVHLGLLPRHRGPAPLFWALHDGDAETGVSIHLMAERVDAGAILAQRRRPVAERTLYPELRELRRLSVDVLYEALERFGRGDIPPATDLPLPPAHRAPKRADVARFLKAGNRFL